MSKTEPDDTGQTITAPSEGIASTYSAIAEELCTALEAFDQLCGECLAREAERDDDGDDRNDSRPELTRSQPADFVGGESTGVQDL